MWYSDEKNCKLGKGAKVVEPMRLKNIESVIAHIIMLDILPLLHLFHLYSIQRSTLNLPLFSPFQKPSEIYEKE